MTPPTASEGASIYLVSLGASHKLVERLTGVLAYAASPNRLTDRDWRPVLLALKDARDVLAAKEQSADLTRHREELARLRTSHGKLVEALKAADALRFAVTNYMLCLSGDQLRQFERMICPSLENSAKAISDAAAQATAASGEGKP